MNPGIWFSLERPPAKARNDNEREEHRREKQRGVLDEDLRLPVGEGHGDLATARWELHVRAILVLSSLAELDQADDDHQHREEEAERERLYVPARR